MKNLYNAYDNYGFRYLPYHLKQSGRKEALQGLLFQVEWLQEKLVHTNVDALILDFTLLPEDPDLSLIRKALELSRPALALDTNQLAIQLIGRLGSAKGSKIESFLRRLKEMQVDQPRLIPNFSSLRQDDNVRFLLGHNQPITAITYVDRKDIAASGDKGGTIKIWDISLAVELKELTAHSSTIKVLLPIKSLGNDVLVSADLDGNIVFWDMSTWSKIKHWPTRIPIETIVSSDDGQRAAVIHQNGFAECLNLVSCEHSIWLLNRSDEFLFRAYGAGVESVSISSDGKRIVTKYKKGKVDLYDFERDEIHGLAADQIYSSAYTSTTAMSPDGRFLFLGDEMVDLDALNEWKSVHLESDWDARTIRAIMVAREKNVVLFIGSYEAKFWNFAEQREISTISIFNAQKIAISSDASTLLMATAESIEVQHISLSPSQSKSQKFKPKHNNPRLSLQSKSEKFGHNGPILWIVRLPTSPIIATASFDGTIKIWNTETFEEIFTLIGHDRDWWIPAVTFVPGTEYLVSVSADRTARIWNYVRSDQIKSISLDRNGGPVKIPISVAITENPDIAIIGFQSGRYDDGTDLAQKGFEGGVEIWDLKNECKLKTIVSNGAWRGLVLSKDKHFAICGSLTGELIVLDLLNDFSKNKLNGHRNGVYSISLTHDDICAITSGGDGTIKVWDWQIGKMIYEIAAHLDVVYATDVSADATYIVSVSADCYLKVWDLKSGKLAASFRNDVGITACSILDGDQIVLGDDLGKLHFLSLENYSQGSVG